jgi:hypothetical protein
MNKSFHAAGEFEPEQPGRNNPVVTSVLNKLITSRANAALEALRRERI